MGSEIIEAVIEDKNDLMLNDVKVETPLSFTEQRIAELRLKAYSPLRIAQELDLPEKKVRQILNRKAVKLFINEAMKQVKSSIKDELVALHLKIIEDKVREVETEFNGDFSKATKKDLPDLIKTLDDILKEEERAKLGTTQSVYINILNQVLEK